MVGRSVPGLLAAAAIILLASVCFAAAAYMPQIAASPDYGPALVTGTADFGSGNNEALLLFADPDSGYKWSSTWGRSTDVYPGDIAMDSSGAAVVVGSYPFLQQYEYAATPAWVIKYTNNGTLEWEREITWADYSIRLNSVTIDPLGDIYATGLAWKYDDVADPDGWFAQVGFIFTCRLTADGEIVWAHRWSRDFYSRDQGTAIAVYGNTIGVLAEFRDEGNPGFVMLFSDATNGTTFATQALVIPDEVLLPVGLAANSNGQFTAIVALRSYFEDLQKREYILMPCFLPDGTYIFVQSWSRGQKTFSSVHDISSSGSEFYIAGGLGSRPEPPNPEGPDQVVLKPLVLGYDGPYSVFEKYMLDDSGKYDSTSFSSIARGPDNQLWVAGEAVYTAQQTILDENVAFAGYFGFSNEPLVQVAAWDDANCGSSSLPISGSVYGTPGESEVHDWFNAQNLYIGSVIFDYVEHIPNAVLTADVTEGPGPLTVRLDASDSTIDIGSIENYEWSWYRKDLTDMDNDYDTGTSTIVTFTEPGTYVVAVKLTSDDGSTSSAWVEVKVQPPPA